MDKFDIRTFISKADCSLEQVMRELSKNGNKIQFLEDEKGKLVGCLTDGDIRRYFLGGGKIEDRAFYAANKQPRIAKSKEEARKLFSRKNYIVIPIVDINGYIIDLYDGEEESRSLLLLGAGGHCRSVLDSVLNMHAYNKIGIIDYDGSTALGIPVVGTDEDLPELMNDGWTDAFITVGSVGNTLTRRRLLNTIQSIGFRIPAIIDPTAVIARNVKIGYGTFVGKGAIINTGSYIGCCTIINTGSIVEHDCVIGNFVHVSPGTTICGQVRVDDDSHIGAGTVVRQQIKIGKGSLIGAGSVVVKNIPDKVKAYGNPCVTIQEL